MQIRSNLKAHIYITEQNVRAYYRKLDTLNTLIECSNRSPIHLSNVLTDHFSNFLSEETTNDIRMKFLQCHFKTTFYRLPLPTRGIYSKIIHVRRKAIFMFYRTCIACINTITFQIGYFYKTVNLLTRKAQNTVEFETMLCSTLLKIMAVCSVFYRKRQFRTYIISVV